MKKTSSLIIIGSVILLATGTIVGLKWAGAQRNTPPAPQAHAAEPKKKSIQKQRDELHHHIRTADNNPQELYRLNCRLAELLRRNGTTADRHALLTALHAADKYSPDGKALPRELNIVEGWCSEVITQSHVPLEVTGKLPINSPGKYEVIFSYKGGSEGGNFEAVELYDGDRKIAEDRHEGFAGFQRNKNTYHLNVPSEVKQPRLFITFDMPQKHNSQGEIAIIKNELSLANGWSPSVLPLTDKPTELLGPIPITDPGHYNIRFNYIRGNDGCIIRSVKLCDGDKKIAEDHHEGFAGTQHRKNTYHLHVRTPLKEPKLFISFDMQKQRNSYGSISVSKNELSLQWGWCPRVLPSNYVAKELHGPLPISRPGTYELTFTYTSGNHALRVLAVELYDGQQIVAQDFHAGQTGHKHLNNSYRLKVHRPVKEPRIFVTFDMTEENDSYGNISLRAL